MKLFSFKIHVNYGSIMGPTVLHSIPLGSKIVAQRITVGFE